MTLPHSEQLQAQHVNLTEVTIQSMDLEVTVTAGFNVEVETSPIVQETPMQPLRTCRKVVVQCTFYQKLTVPTPSKDQG